MRRLPAVPGIAGPGVFASLIGLYLDGADSGFAFDGGIIYLLDRATQRDVNFGTTLTDNTSDFAVGAGVARRF